MKNLWNSLKYRVLDDPASAGLLIGFAVLLAMTFATVALSQEPDKDGLHQMLSPVVKINGTCSAVVYRSEYEGTGENGGYTTLALTANHCVRRRPQGYVTFETLDRGQLIKETRVVYQRKQIDESSDLAVIEFLDRSRPYSTASIAQNVIVRQGDPVWNVGFPFGDIKTFGKGVFQGYSFNLDRLLPGHWIRASAPVMPGVSGGPLYQFNPETGYEIIGITASLNGQFEVSGVFSTLKNIRRLTRLGELPPVTVPAPVPSP